MVDPVEHDENDLVSEARNAAKPVLEDLRRRGVGLQSLAQLINEDVDYVEAIPTLIEWLPRTENAAVKETIVRALTVRDARPRAARIIIEEFKLASQSDTPGLKWAMGNALSVVADASVFDEIADLARDRTHGRSRQMLAVALARIGGPQATEILIELLADQEMVGHAVLGLRKLAPPSARSYLEQLTDHSTTWIRNEARKAIAKIDRRESR